jgi:hypothetical protein
MTESIVKRSATDTLIAAMQGFSESEPTYLVCIWVDEAGDISMCRTERTGTTMQLGLLSAAQMMVGAYLGVNKEDAG